MIVTIITTKPARLESGTEVRNYYLFKALVEAKVVAKLNLVYINTNASASHMQLHHAKLNLHVFSLPSRTFTESFGAYVHNQIPYIEHLKNHVYHQELQKLAEQSDVVFCSELDGYLADSQALNQLTKKPKIILDCHNVDYLRFKSEIESGNSLKKILGKRLLSQFKSLEIDATQQANQILCCSSVDKRYFTQFKNPTQISVVPNGVSISRPKKTSLKKPATLLFMGLLSYLPNEDALKFYISEIHPTVKQKFPEIKCVILGKGAPKWLLRAAQLDSSIEVKGFVKSIDSYLDHATICICPLRFGSGTRLKILEYMAAGKAVVSTSIGCEGIDVQSGQHVLIADSATDFAQAIEKLLTQPQLVNKLGTQARTLVSRNYDWHLIGQNLITILKKEVAQ